MMTFFTSPTASMRALAMASFVIATAAISGNANACSCMPQRSPKAALADADAVFEAGVTGFEKKGESSHAYVTVLGAWKGVKPGARIDVTTASSRPACGVRFEVGKKYVIYAWRQEGRWRTGACSRTALSEDANEDFTELGPPKT